MISEAQSNLSKDKVADYRRVIKKMFAYIGKLEKKFGMYITEVIKQSRIKKGGRIFEHGVSVGRVSELLGVSSWEMMNYIGNTKLSDIGPTYRKDVEGRLEYARRIFNV